MTDTNTDSEKEQTRLERIKHLLGKLSTYLPSSEETCYHKEIEGVVDHDEESIWHLQDTYLKGDPYWGETDAAFSKLRERVKHYRCLGCGEKTTIKTGEVITYRWKSEMTAEEIREMREQVDCGSWYNGRLWWEHNVWEEDVFNVATEFDRRLGVGYTKWKDEEKN